MRVFTRYEVSEILRQRGGTNGGTDGRVDQVNDGGGTEPDRASSAGSFHMVQPSIR